MKQRQQDKYLNPLRTLHKPTTIFKMSYKHTIGEAAVVSIQKGPSATCQPKSTEAV